MRSTIEKLLKKHGWSFEMLEEKGSVKFVIDSTGMEPLCIEYLGKNVVGLKQFSVTHYYENNGDMVPDPDMEFIEIEKEGKKKWLARTFENSMIYQDAYSFADGKMYVKQKLSKELESFVRQWKGNIKSTFIDGTCRIEKYE